VNGIVPTSAKDKERIILEEITEKKPRQLVILVILTSLMVGDKKCTRERKEQLPDSLKGTDDNRKKDREINRLNFVLNGDSFFIGACSCEFHPINRERVW
jgi:hypothetical protein